MAELVALTDDSAPVTCTEHVAVQPYSIPNQFSVVTVRQFCGERRVNKSPAQRAGLSRFDLLILDDFGLAPMTELGKQDLLDIIDARVKTASTLLAGQLPFKEWHSYIDNPMVADAILDRMINTSHRVQLTGESMRKLKAGPTS